MRCIVRAPLPSEISSEIDDHGIDFSEIEAGWDEIIDNLYNKLDTWEAITFERKRSRGGYIDLLDDTVDIMKPVVTDPAPIGVVRAGVVVLFKCWEILNPSEEEIAELNHLYDLKNAIWKDIFRLEDIAKQFPDDAPRYFDSRGIAVEVYKDRFYIDRVLLMNYGVIRKFW